MIPYFFSELPLRKDLSIRNPYELYHEISQMNAPRVAPNPCVSHRRTPRGDVHGY